MEHPGTRMSRAAAPGACRAARSAASAARLLVACITASGAQIVAAQAVVAGAPVASVASRPPAGAFGPAPAAGTPPRTQPPRSAETGE